MGVRILQVCPASDGLAGVAGFASPAAHAAEKESPRERAGLDLDPETFTTGQAHPRDGGGKDVIRRIAAAARCLTPW